MKRSTPRVLPSNTRVIISCLLSLAILALPLSPVAAASYRNRRISELKKSETKSRSGVPSEEEAAKYLFGSQPVAAPLPAGAITATKADSFPDLNADGKAEPGETISYTVDVTNTGATDATGVAFADTIDLNTTLVPGSLKVSPLAFADNNYSTAINTPLNVAAPGVLTNDTGTPAPTAVPIAAGPTTGGGTVTLNADGSFTYTPTAVFTGADTFTYTVTNGQTPNDTATVTINVDAVPSVTTTSPVGGSTVATNTNIVVNFSEAVNVTTSSFTIECPTGSPQTFGLSGSGTTAITLDPTADLPGGVACTITVVANQVSDVDTNDPPDNMASNFVFTLNTDAAPTVTTTSPTNGASGIPANANIVVNFSEAVNATTSSFTIECPTPGSLQAYAVSGSGTSAITLNPTADLPVGTICTVTVIANQISDTDSFDPPNLMAANFAFSFTTDAPPAVTTTTPTNGATGVAANANIVVNFSENVNVTASAFTLQCPVATPIAFTLTPAVPGATNSFTLDPNADLPGGVTCTVTVVANQVTDTDANDPPDQMAANHVFTFTVDAAPSVTSTTPTNGATTVAANTNIVVNFSENVNVTASTFTLECPSGVANAKAFTLTPAVPGGTNSFTLNPDADLPFGVTCTVTVVANQVSDVDMSDPPDNMVANHVFTFTVDNPPSVTTTNPTNGATGIAANTNIVVNFSESVNATTNSFVIECPAASGARAYTLNASPSNTFTLNPTSDLPEGVICTVTVVATEITDADSGDPPDQMLANHVFSFSIPPRAVDDSRNATGNIQIVTTGRSNFSVLSNDVFPVADPVTVTAFDATSARGGNVSLVAATGTFSYNPPAGYEGTDTFNYTITNAAGSDVGTVTITIAGMIWFIDDNPASGACTTNNNICGRLTHPFTTIAAFEAANGNATPTNGTDVIAPEAGDHIFIYSGSYTAPLTLENNQRVIGQAATSSLQTISGITPATDSDTLPSTGGTAPSITSGGNGFNLANGNQLHGLTFTNTTGTAISGAVNVGTFTMNTIVVNNAASAGAGISFSAGGTVTATGTNTITTRSGVALNVSSTLIGTGNLNFVSISAGNNTADADPANGIVLNATGTTAGVHGSLIIAGGGNTTLGGNSSGGTIQRTTGHGIALTSTRSPSFNNMNLQFTGGSGVNGTQVVNFTFTNGTVNSAGDGSDESSFTFDDSTSAANVSGTLTVTNCIISLTEADGFDIENSTGTLDDVIITGNTISDTGDVATPGSAIRVVALGNASTVANVTKASLNNNTITDFRAGAGFVLQGGNSQDSAGAPAGMIGQFGNATNVISVTGNFMNGGSGGIGNQPDRFITATVNGRGQGNFNISSNGNAGNRIRNIDGVVIELSAFGNTQVEADINSNFVQANNAVASAGFGIGCDADSLATTTDNATMNVFISNNNITQTDGPGIYTLARGASTCVLNVAIKNNTVAAPATTSAARAGIRVDSGSSGSTTTVCLDITGNTTAGSTNSGTGSVSPGINLRREAGASVFGIEGMAATSSPGVENYVNGLNTSSSGTFGVGGTALLSATTGFSNCSNAPNAFLRTDKKRGDDLARIDNSGNEGTASLFATLIGGDIASVFGNDYAPAPSAPVTMTADNSQPTQSVSPRLEASGEWGVIYNSAPEVQRGETAVAASAVYDNAPANDNVRTNESETSGTTATAQASTKDVTIVPASYAVTDEAQPTAFVKTAAYNDRQPVVTPLANASNEQASGRGEMRLSHNSKTRKARTLGAAVASAKAMVMTPAAPAPSGETVNATIGTLPAGKTVRITFQVTIDNAFSGTQVSNQGTVSGTFMAAPFNTVTDDPGTGAADDATVTPVLAEPNISINDGSVAEPASGSANAVFTVVLSHAYSQTITVNFTTNSGGANPATAGSDYSTTSGQVVFPAGETIQSISVPVLADADNSETNETFLVDLTGTTDGVIVDAQATGTITTNNPAGTVLISELRTSGPGGSGDDFVEILNATDSDITVPASGWALVKSGATCDNTPVIVAVIASGTVIPARGNYLLTGSAYSLANYGGTNAATGDQTLSVDIEDDRNVALFSTATPQNFATGTRLDAVGFGTNVLSNCDLLREGSPLPAASGSTSEYSFVRKVDKGETLDTNANTADFIVVSTTPATAVGNNLTPTLGAPGPEKSTSPRGPVPCNGAGTAKFGRDMLDSSQSANSAPNVVRDPTPDAPNNSTLGTIDFRRRFTNNTGAPVTRLRFRIVDMTTSPSVPGTADLRARTSAQIMVPGVNDTVTCAGPAPCTAQVEATTIETPPAQALGGGVNSSFTVTLGTPLANGASANLHFLFGVEQVGDYHIGLVLETLPGTAGTLGKDIWELNGNTETGGHTDGGCIFVNAAPVNTVPASPVNKDEDVDLVFTGATQISIADADAGSATVRVSLTSTNGVFSLSGTAGLDFACAGCTGDGTDDSSMVFEGTIANINTALNNLTFKTALNFVSPPNASLTILTDDLGNTGVGGSMTDSDTITITVNGVNDPPSFTLAGNPAAVNEDAGAQTVNSFATSISQGTGDSGQTLTFNISAAGTTGNLAFSSGPAIDPATGNLTYTPSANTNGTATFNVTLSDNGSNVPPNSNTSGTQQFTITVNAVNDAPTFTLAAGPTVNEDAGAQTINNFATGFQPGPAAATDEAGQTLVGYTVSVTGTTGSLTFSSDPAIDNAGTLTFTATGNTSGTATVSVTATDSGSGTAPNVNTSAAQQFTITVNGVNDAPSFTIGGNPAAVNEDAGAQTVSGFATSISQGPGESGQTLTFNVSAAGTTGNIAFSSAPAIDPATGNLTYTASANTNGTATFNVTLMDSGGTAGGGQDTSATQQFTITVNAVNDAPTFQIPSNPPAVNESAGAQTINSFATNFQPGPLTATDEVGQTLVGYTVTQTGTTGSLTFSSGPAISNAGQLTYTPTSGTSGTATFDVVATDSGSGVAPNVNQSAAVSFTITVTSVNDAPVLDNTGNMTLTSINEDVPDASNPGTLVSDIIASAGGNRITDTDAGDPEGIAVIAVDNTSGTWQFSINNGTNWTAFGTPDATTARLLASDAMTRIRFVPNLNFNGTVDPGITFRAWDQTSGTNGNTANVTTNGGSTAFSTATETASITVGAQNDNPTTTGLAAVAVNEDAPDTVIDLRLSFNDAEDGAAGLVYTIQANTNAALFTSTNINNANDNLTLDYAPNASGVAQITIRATDTAGLFVDSTFMVTVSPVADTPSVTNATTSVNTQTTSGLVISRNAVDGAEVTHFKITNIQNGSLFQNNGTTPIATGSFITFAEGNAGLKFTPALNFTGTATFDIQASTSNVDAGLGGSVITASITVGCGSTVVTSSASSGAGSLRDVINMACPGATITFDMTTVTSPVQGGDILINKNLTITGPGADLLAVQAGFFTRIFSINPGNIVSISGLTLRNAEVSLSGGAINNSGTLTLDRVAISNNRAGSGGGIFNSSTGTLAITNSTISGNTAHGFTDGGGGIHNNGVLSITNSTISGNTANSNNGGGILNSATGTLTLTNVTVTGNRAPSGVGGGIVANGTETLNNTIVAGNSRGPDGFTTPDDISGTINTANNNLVGDAATSGGIANGVSGNKVGNSGAGTININTVLNTTLANNGGPTQTHALVAGSPAIDAASNALAPSTDQRGVARPLDGDGNGSLISDIGAFELDNSTPTTTGISDVTVAENAPDTVINLFPSFADVETSDAALVYSVQGNTNPALFTNVSIAAGNLTLDYAPNAVGTSTLTIRATDTGGAFVQTSFNVTVLEGGTLQFNSATFSVNENGGTATITIVRGGGGSAGTATVLFQTSNGTATAADYTPVSQTVTFLQGEVIKTVSVPITNDPTDETHETVNLSLTNAGGSGQLGAPVAAVLTITDDDATPTFSIADASVTEGDSGTTVASFLVTLSAPSSLTTTVTFLTANGTATVGSDYGQHFGTLTFTPGETTQAITVNVVGDVFSEANETFFVDLSAPTNAVLADSQGVGTILNDDAAGGVFKFSAANYNTTENSGTTTITVQRTGDTTMAATIDYATSDDSDPASMVSCANANGIALSRCDFTTATGTLRFAAGETSKTFSVLISQDSYVEGTEALTLALSNPTNGAVLGTPANSVLSITDDVPESATNVIDDTEQFIRAHYHDFLSREADAPGLAFWVDNINKCNDPARRPAGQTVAQCIDKQRESTSSAFFFAPEFQATGGFVFRLYKGSLGGVPNYDGGSMGRFPTYLEFIKDVRQVSEGIIVGNQISGAVLEANRTRLAEEFILRPEFQAIYGGLNNTQFVDKLFQTTGITPTAAQRQALIDGLANATETKASVLRKVVDGTVFVSENNIQFNTPYGQAFIVQELRRTFVFMEYVGYLRRNPDQAGFVFWLGKLNMFNGDFFQAQMVRSFIVSPEYRSRFGQP